MILVTGSSGYLGRHVLRRLIDRRLRCIGVSRYDGDLTDPDDVLLLLQTVQPDVVIHCAACVPKSPEEYHDVDAALRSAEMTGRICDIYRGPIVFASSLTASEPSTAYARGKRKAERFVALHGGVSLRLPGLFGLPRRSGVIYQAARTGVIPDSFGPYPAMHVADAAEYLVRAASMPHDGNPEPFSVTYGDPRLEACYGSLGVTFDQRVQEFVEALRGQPC